MIMEVSDISPNACPSRASGEEESPFVSRSESARDVLRIRDDDDGLDSFDDVLGRW